MRRNLEGKLRARALRRRMSTAELIFWQAIREKASGFTFRRQYALGKWFLDFYCPEARVCVEIDGPYHDSMADAQRDFALANEGILVVRIPAEDVHEHSGVLLKRHVHDVLELCRSRASRP